VVTEAIYAKMVKGLAPLAAIQEAMREIQMPLLGSTLTPVVVFIPLAFLDGVPGVFFRALGISMVVALLASLVLAVTLTPSMAAAIVRVRRNGSAPQTAHSSGNEEYGGAILSRLIRFYGFAIRAALKNLWFTLGLCVLVLLGSVAVYWRLESDFLPEMDEGGFVIDYIAPPGTSLTETNRALLQVEDVIKKTEEIESYSRRTGAALGFGVVEPNTGDFLVKLKPERKRRTKDVIADVRKQLLETQPHIEWEFPGILSDLIGDMTSSPEPIEIKLFSQDISVLKKTAPAIKNAIRKVDGVVDEKDGLIAAGPSISLHIKSAEAQRFGMDADFIAKAVSTAIVGQVSSSILQGDRVMNIRVMLNPTRVQSVAQLRELMLRSPDGTAVILSQVADIREETGDLELHRDNLRQNVSITARLEGRDLGSAMEEIRAKLKLDDAIPSGSIEFGGLYRQQQESFQNLVLVLIVAIVLVFIVLLLEFRSFLEPIAIVFGAILALSGTVLALWITGTTLNIISFLGAIIGVGIVAKNGILMLDFVETLRKSGLSLDEALTQSGQRRLRPVLMTSLAAALGMLPLAYGIGSGADMLKPLAIAVIGALAVSVLLSLIATPAMYALLKKFFA
jgi:multidrug efflux pump subunit AcrB